MSNLEKGALKITEYFDGEKVPYYPYLTPQPCVYVSPATTRRVIGEDLFGNQIYEYTRNINEVLNQYCREWLAKHPTTCDTVQALS